MTARTPLRSTGPVGRGQKRLQGLLGPAQGIFIRGQGKGIDLLIRIVQNRVKMAAQVGQHFINRLQPGRQRAAHLSGGIGGGIRRLGFNQIDDGLRLGQIHAPVEKSPLGKLSPAGGPGPRLIQGLQPRSQHGRRAVAVQLHGVLPGIAVRTPGVHRHALVQRPALPVQKRPQNQLPVGRFRQRTAVFGPKYPPGHLPAAGARQAQNADGADLTSCGYGGNDMRHRNPS